MRFWIEPAVSPAGEKRTFEIHREGWGRVISLALSTRERAEEEVRRSETEETWGNEAMHDPDHTVLCEAGWHRAFDSRGIRYFFRLRRGWGGCALAYHVAWEPIEYKGRTIGNFSANAKPWRCEACGEEVGAPGAADGPVEYWQI